MIDKWNNYKLELPPIYAKIHPWFSAWKLMKLIEPLPHQPRYTNPDAVLVDGEEEYELDFIVNHRSYGNKRKYRCRWKGYSPTDDTWEDETHLENAADVLNDYWSKVSAQASTVLETSASGNKLTKAETNKTLADSILAQNSVTPVAEKEVVAPITVSPVIVTPTVVHPKTRTGRTVKPVIKYGYHATVPLKSSFDYYANRPNLSSIATTGKLNPWSSNFVLYPGCSSESELSQVGGCHVTRDSFPYTYKRWIAALIYEARRELGEENYKGGERVDNLNGIDIIETDNLHPFIVCVWI